MNRSPCVVAEGLPTANPLKSLAGAQPRIPTTADPIWLAYRCRQWTLGRLCHESFDLADHVVYESVSRVDCIRGNDGGEPGRRLLLAQLGQSFAFLGSIFG